MAKLSYVTACYNSAKFIERLASSIRNQSSLDFEWICVDDNSSDGTLEKLRDISISFPAPMRIYSLEENSGGGVAYWRGIQEASGEIVCIIDHDDELERSSTETILRDWARLSKETAVSGIFYRTSDPKTGKTNGPEFRSGVYNYAYFQDFIRKQAEFLTVVESQILRSVYTLDYANNMTMWGVVWEDVARSAPFFYEGSIVLRVYYRDNVQSQSNLVRVSAKTVWTYAKLFDHFGFYKAANPWRYFKILIILMRFSDLVHKSPWIGVRLVRSKFIKLVAILAYPIYRLLGIFYWKNQQINLKLEA